MIIQYKYIPGQGDCKRDDLERDVCRILLSTARRNFNGECSLNDFKFIAPNNVLMLEETVTDLQRIIGHKLHFRGYYNNLGKLAYVVCTNFTYFVELPDKYLDLEEDFPESLH